MRKLGEWECCFRVKNDDNDGVDDTDDSLASVCDICDNVIVWQPVVILEWTALFLNHSCSFSRSKSMTSYIVLKKFQV